MCQPIGYAREMNSLSSATTIALEEGAASASLVEGDAMRRMAAWAVVTGLVVAAGYVGIYEPYHAGSSLGYNLGLVGGILMLLLLPYSLRKRLRSLRQAGTMRGWFLFHIFAGLLGPLLVLFHSTFRIGSFNGGIALASTLLVTASGTIGRFFYRKVHRGLTGNRATQEEFHASLNLQMAELQSRQGRSPVAVEEVHRYLALAANVPATRLQRASHFLSLAGQRRIASRRIRRDLTDAVGTRETQLLQTIDATLLAAQRTAQFATYERLFALWHVVHIPFLYLLVLTSAVHVVAVHAY